MVQLHCIERGVAPARPTDDVDAALDVRAEPGVLRTFTAALADVIQRPNLLGALVAKAAAHSVVLDRARAPHPVDFAVLTTPLRPSDHTDQAGRRDRKYLEAALTAPAADKRNWASVDGAAEGELVFGSRWRR